MATRILKTEPGGYAPWIARFCSGWAGLSAMAFQFSSLSQVPLETLETPALRRIDIADGTQQSWLHYLDGRIVSESTLPAVPIYVR